MIQKPAPKNGQKFIHDVIPKTSSAEPQQQQRKGERANLVQDVAKKPSGSGVNGHGGYHHSANHGVANGHVENGRGNQANGSNGVVPAHAAQNGFHGRANGNSGSKPGHVAAGNAAVTRSQPNGASVQPVASKPGGRPPTSGPYGVKPTSANGTTPATGVPGPHVAAVPNATGGGRIRDAVGAAYAYPSSGATPANGAPDAGAGMGSAFGGRAREPRRRGGRGRGGHGGEGPAGGADVAGVEGGVENEVANATMARGDTQGRPRGGRRQRGPGGEQGDAEGPRIGEPTANDVAGQPGEGSGQGDADYGTQRSGRPRGRRGRGGQQNGPVENGEQGGVADRLQALSLSQFQQPCVEGGEQLPERRPRHPRQRPPRGPRGQPAGQLEQEPSAPWAAADGEQQSTGSRPQRQRRGREPRQGAGYQDPQAAKLPAHEPGADDKDGVDGPYGTGRVQGRGGRRRNGPGPEIAAGASAAPAGAPDAAAPELPGGHAEGDAAASGRRPKASPSARLPQPQFMDVPQPSYDQPPVEQQQQPASQAAMVQAQPSAPQMPPPVQVAQGLPPQQQQQPPLVMQQQYQQPPFQDGLPLVGFSQSLLQHMVSQHPYPPPPQDFQQQHFLQPPQFDHNFQHFQQHHQQMLQQHLAPAPPAPHNYLAGAFSAPGGPLGGPAPMPTYYAAGGNPYGQMLPPPPPPPVFGGAPTPPMPQGPVPPFAPASQLASEVAPQPEQQPEPLRAPQQQEQQDDTSAANVLPPPPPQPLEQPLASATEQQPVTNSSAVLAPAAVEPNVPVAAAAAGSAAEVPAVEPVKNEWADRLAQQALARMNAVKSSLISGASSFSEGPGGGAGADERARAASQQGRSAQGPGPYVGSPRGAPVEPESWRGAGDADSGGRRIGGPTSAPSETWRNVPGGGAAPGDPSNGWRSSLAPTGVADAADAWRLRSPAEESGATQAPAPYQPPRREESPPPPPSTAAAGAGARPRLNLQPRTRPLPPPSGAPAAALVPAEPPAANGSSASAGARSSIFGAARPREEVLRERGVAEPERLTTGNVAYANGSSTGAGSARMGGRAGSVTSGVSDEDQWQTVGKGGRSKPPPSSDVGNALLDAASDPFFTGRSTGHGVAIVGRSIPAGRVYSGGNGAYGGSSYGKGSIGSHGGETYMNAYGVSRGYGNSYGNEDDEPIFKRGLPTRNDGVF